MAGIQSCYRKLLLVGTSRVISKNVILHQPSRGRHNLVFQISFQQSNSVFSKTRLNFGRQFIYRLASTNVTEGKDVLKNPEVSASAKDAAAGSSGSAAPAESPGVVIDEAALPPVPTVEGDAIPVLEFVSSGLTEPSIKSLGLGSWYPSGMLQQFMEYIHVGLDWPWWAAIATVTFVLRIFTFPVTLSARRDTINFMNNMPQISQFQQKISEAKRVGDYFLAATHMQELQAFVGEKKINMFSFIKPLFFQTPFFISMFWGLRGMAEAPVETFKTQGLFWFSDLTATDPYYLLPLILSTSMYAVLKVGADGVTMQSAQNPFMQLMMKGLPIGLFAVATQFSACICWYWTVSNFFVLMQTGLLKVPAVAKFFNVPKAIKHEPSAFAPKKGFVAEFKEGLSNAKLTKEVEERERLNTLTFEKAGTAAIPRTFKHNPKLANAPKAVANKL